MKNRIIIYNYDHLPIYEGKILDLPIKMSAIKEKSMQVFRDPDPCIIHQSYVIQQMIAPLIGELKKGEEIQVESLVVDLSWLDLPSIETCSILLKG